MALTSGMKLGPYEVQSSLGAGGMGEVYRAHDSRLDRTVAIKVLPASFSADRDRLQRFATEARAAAALNHPNILSIFDIGDNHGAPYVVSELLEGETLRDRLRSGPLPPRKAIDYALQVARGLAAAHEKGIVHRDLKPENLFLTNDGRVKILDFGLAKLTNPEPSSGNAEAPTVQPATEPGLVMGTVGYMSPEQVRGKAADPRSDIFAFGAILYEMISGKRAFHGETTADTMSAILKEEVPDLSETARNVPPGLERIVQHCLEKNPAQRFHSASDLAFDLDSLTGISSTSKSGTQVVVEAGDAGRGRMIAAVAGVIALAAAMLGMGWWLGHGGGAVAPAEYQQITFRMGSMGNGRFTPDGSVVYNASWEGGDDQLYMARTDENGSRELGIKNAELLSISKSGELAIRLDTRGFGGYATAGTLARVPLSGGTPREVLDNVQDADWAADGQNMAVVRYVPETAHWRLEYPIGKVLLEGINWISHPKISPDGKWVAFADHENVGGDDEGSVAVIGPDGHEKKLASKFVSLEGVLWSPAGDEIWFTATRTGAADNLRGVTLAGKERTITNVPGGMWLQDMRNGVALMIAHQIRIGIRGLAPGAKEEKELGWFGWSIPRDFSRDGKKILFEEDGDGGGPNYTVFLRDTDGSPPVKMGEGTGRAISPDGKWVITQPAKEGALALVPTGAGETRQLTHDNISYHTVRYMPDGKQLLAAGIEPGHGVRDYLIDLASGDAKPITPEGLSGTHLSPDGRSVAVLGPDGKWGVWPMPAAGTEPGYGVQTSAIDLATGDSRPITPEGRSGTHRSQDGPSATVVGPDGKGSVWPLKGSWLRPIPDLDSKYYLAGWTPDGTSLYVLSNQQGDKAAKVYRVNTSTGKMEFWKQFGSDMPKAGIKQVAGPMLSTDGNAYAYLYSQALSVAYAVRGLR